MLVPVLLFIIGLLFLIKGGDWFVDGASALARRFHLPELLIGATVVSIGTTLPEVMVSTMSAVSGHGEIAYGNAIGSVICNSALIAAITIAVRPGKVDPKTLRVPVAFFFAAAAIYCVAAYAMGEFTRPLGFVMLAMFVAYMVANVLQMKKAPAAAEAEAEAENAGEEMSLTKTLVLLVLGAVLIALGANLLVDNGTLIAQALGVPESVIALTFVALGTSLPELVTAITSLVKGCSDLSLGNIVGANVFNLVLVSGVSVTLAPFTVPQSSTLFGIGSSLCVAKDTYLKFLRLDKPCVVNEDSHSQLLQARNATAQDVGIVFSYSGQTMEMIQCIKEMKAGGAPVIAVTRYYPSEVAQLADHVLYVAANESLFRNGAMSSRLSQLNVMDILYTAYASRNHEDTMRRLAKTHIYKPGDPEVLTQP